MAKGKKKEDLAIEGAIVKPTMRFDGDKAHVLETLLKENDAPTLKSIGYMRMPGLGQSAYVAYVITSKGNKVLEIEVEEPNLKAIAEESAKISFVNNFMRGEE